MIRRLTQDTISQFHKKLDRWYQTNGRHNLPWRNTNDPYAIYISEIMLQQTQVKTVLDRFYFPFLQRFPTLKALASASEKEVLSAWQGLGYYTRARNLHRAAQQCNGQLPKTVDGLMALPGIGKNTAHAISALGYREPFAVMEANVKRILCRIFAFSTPTSEQLWNAAETLLNRKEPFHYNQAMMDIGAMVCTPTNPNCGECPAANICMGKTAPEDYPQRQQKKAVPVRHRQIVILVNQAGKYYATPRLGKFLGGLYQFIEIDSDSEGLDIEGVSYPKNTWEVLGKITQKYSHFTLEAEVFRLIYKESHPKTNWHRMDTLKKLPMSMAEQKILRLLEPSNADT
jgi:A/G-specific adenine glycosylase